MATTTEQQQSRRASGANENFEEFGSLDVGRSQESGRRWLAPLVIIILIVALIGGVAYAGAQWVGSMGADDDKGIKTHVVKRDNLVVTLIEDGNVESASNVELKCEVEGGSTILFIVQDGKEVQKGEKLVELDSAALEDQINAQKITYEKAKAAAIQAEKDFEVAKISVEEYEQGVYQQELQNADKQIAIAEEDLRSAENALAHSRRMFRKGYVSSLELEAQEFAVTRAKLELASMNTAKDVLEKYTKKKMLEDLKSQVETARSKMESENAALALEKSKLDRLSKQLEKCVIYAPQDGMVVYANQQGGRFGGQQGPQIEEGATVRERQTILRVPDLSHMQVKVNVHETKVKNLRPGMRARIKIQGRKLQGEVTSIANQPEPTSWFSGSIKEYATTVTIDGTSKGLKPGMTAEVEILIDKKENVLTLPVAAVVENRGQYYCWVVEGDEIERRAIQVGLSNDIDVEIKGSEKEGKGIEEGDEVMLNPRKFIEEARKEAEVEEDTDVASKFGESSSSKSGSPQSGRGDGGKDAGGGTPSGGPPSGKGEQSGGRGQAEGGRSGEERSRGGRGFDMSTFDKDGDGKLSREEAPGRMQENFDRIDQNKDGFIDQSDFDAMRRARGAGGAQGGGAPGGGFGGQ